MSTDKRLSQFIIGFCLLSCTVFAEAGIPLWYLTPDPNFPPNVSVTPTETATIKFTVHNNSQKKYRLIMTPIIGISQLEPCTLLPKGSCTLELTVNGSAMKSNMIQGGPSLCQANDNNTPNPNRCYQPASVDRLNISRVTSSLSNYMAMAAGSYVDDNGDNRPLLVFSPDQGENWTYPASINNLVFTPDNLSNPYLQDAFANSVSCNSSICIIAGNYDSATERPLIAYTTNQGVDWSYPSAIPNINFISRPFLQGRLESSVCGENFCLGVGFYSDNLWVRYPFAVSTMDNGATWNFSTSADQVIFVPDNISHPMSGNAQFGSVSCSELLCIAAGNYQDTTPVNRPLLALSQDHGINWSYPSIINEVQFTPNNLSHPFNDAANLIGSSCSKNNSCFAVGNYLDNVAQQRPLLVQSLDAGLNWSYPSSINDVQFTPDNLTHPFLSQGFLSSVSCSDNLCITVGRYTDTNAITRPLIALTNDGGLNWTYPSAPTQVQFTPDNTSHPFQGNGVFYSSTCSGNTCMAAGEYIDNNNINRPLLAISSDSGNNWIYPSVINEVIFTPDNISHPFDSGTFYSIQCSGNFCFASGDYLDANGIHRPLIAVTKDLGISWTYPSVVNEVNYTPSPTPHPFYDGGFIATNITRSLSSFLPEALRLIISNDVSTHSEAL